MIAALVIAGQHILVTHNHTDFVDVLPATPLANWMMILQTYRARRGCVGRLQA
jgi:hypothetical protein